MAKQSKSTNVVNLATGKKKTGRTLKTKAKVEEVVEPTVEEVVEPTVEEKAKKLAEDVMSEVDLSPNADESSDLLELDEDDGQPKSMEWLEEQVGALGAENEKLRLEASEAKENYSKLFARYEQLREGGPAGGEAVGEPLVPESLIKLGATHLFDEFQSNYLGHNDQRRRYTEIKLIHLMQKMLTAFPFLEDRRRF